jgi:hypothetical protein
MSGTERGWTEPPVTEAPRPTCDRLWTFQDVSDFLGVPIGTLYQWRVRGEARRPSRSVGTSGSTRIGCGPGSQSRRSDVASVQKRDRGTKVTWLARWRDETGRQRKRSSRA